jgi:integrase
MPTASYTDPQLCDYGGDIAKAWFVHFEISNPTTGEVQRKQFRGGINYWLTPDDRRHAGEGLAREWRKKLKAGWEPAWKIAATDISHLSRMTFLEALKFAMDNYSASTATKRAYQGTIDAIKKAARALQLEKAKASEMRRQHVKLLFQYCISKLGWSNAGFNKHLGYLHAILESLIEWEILEFNPAHKIKPLPVAETEKFIPYTPEEKKRIQEFFFVHHYSFFVYFQVLYHTGIRPKEILALKISDINLAGKEIKIMPDLQEENSKTKKIRRPPINNHLLPFLRELHLEQFPPEYYVFGSPFGPNGNRGKGSELGGISGARRPDYFRPSPTRVKRDTVTKLWKRLVMSPEPDGLGINKYHYAGKRTGGDDKILAGMDLDALKELYGHGSKFMTEKYAGIVKQVRREHIIDHSPAFLDSPGKKKPSH